MSRFRTTLPVAAWPAPARAAWQAVAPRWNAPNGPRAAYGRLLRFFADRGMPLETAPTADIIEAYVAELVARHSIGQALTLFERLFYVLRALQPAENWSWLRLRFLRLRDELRPRDPARRRRPRARTESAPIESWPPHYQERWRQAMAAVAPTDEFVEDEIVEDVSEHTNWAKSTWNGAFEGYARFLFLIREAGVADEVTATSIRCFITRSQTKEIRPVTIKNVVDGVHRFMRVVEPERDWTWLRRTCRNLKRYVAGCDKQKHGRIVDPGEIWVLGSELMQRARVLRQDDYRAAILFRNGLLLAFLACIPVRLRTVALTKIGTHLDLEKGILVYSAAETKERRADFRDIPEDLLLSALREYVAIYRQRLVRDSMCRALWISDQGGALTASSISEIVGDATEVLGVRISPHLIRDCVATVIKEQYPGETEVSRIVLDHRSRQMTAIYQEQATQRLAQNRAREIRDRAKRTAGAAASGRRVNGASRTRPLRRRFKSGA